MSKTDITVYVDELEKDVEVRVDIKDIINNIGEDEILEELGYSIEFCFYDFADLERYVKENLYDFDVPLAEEYSRFHQQNVHDRMSRFIDSNYYDNISYEELDNYLTQKGF